MSDRLAARIRTWWPLILGHIAALAGAAILRLTGIEVDSVLLLELVGLIGSAVVWEVGTRLEHVTGDEPPAAWARTAGRWLLSLGLEIGPPTYGASGSPDVEADRP